MRYKKKKAHFARLKRLLVKGGGVIIRTNVPPLTFQNDSPPSLSLSLSSVHVVAIFFFRFVVFWSNIFFYQSLKIVEIVCVMINPKTKFP